MAARPPALRVTRRREHLVGDDKRIIARLLQLDESGQRARSLAQRVLTLDAAETRRCLSDVRRRFHLRHRELDVVFERHGQIVVEQARLRRRLTRDQQLLIGAYFTMEYSIESAALLNPSMVPHPDQHGVPNGSVRFLLSLRAIGEGHLSSIVFRRGTISPRGRIVFDPPRRHAVTAQPSPCIDCDKRRFVRQLRVLGADRRLAARVLRGLPGTFHVSALERAVAHMLAASPGDAHVERLAADLRWLATANYTLSFPHSTHPAEIVIFPATAGERMGMEDLRLVRFTNDDGSPHYFGTYTAYDGRRIMPMLLDTADFVTFRVRTISGCYARNKGTAIFPRKIGGEYLMVSRHDGERLFLLRSDDLCTWDRSSPLLEPRRPWEMLQIGNCGSPLETEAGWILLTHGVGPVREYSIGAALLDRNNPARVIGRLKDPLIRPIESEREGYVPNVVYSCGAMLHGDRLIIPYAMSDSRSSFATVSVRELVERMLADGP